MPVSQQLPQNHKRLPNVLELDPYMRTLDVLSFSNFSILFYWSPQKDASESPISGIYFNFALPSLWNLLFNFGIWCRLSWAGPLANIRLELKDSTKTLEQNQSMDCIWVIFRHHFRGTSKMKSKTRKKWKVCLICTVC